jgi:hypothetical protein
VETGNSAYWSDSVPGTEYPQERVVPVGRCARGWLPFAVPKGKRPEAVTYSPEDASPVEWRLR